MKFTCYIVHLISEGNDISAMSLMASGRASHPLSGDGGTAAAGKHEDC